MDNNWPRVLLLARSFNQLSITIKIATILNPVINLPNVQITGFTNTAWSKILNEAIEANINLSSQVNAFQKDEVVSELSDELTDIEAEKLKGLSEGVSFEDADQYKQALGTIKENYFPRTAQGRAVVVDEESEVSEQGIVDETPRNAQMARYVDIIGKTVTE